MTVKQLHNHFWNKGIYVNIFKWLGKYDIVYKGKMYNTDARSINGGGKQVRDYFEHLIDQIQKGTLRPVE